MSNQKKTETRKTWQSKSSSREEKLKTALRNAGDDMEYIATSMIYSALWPLYKSGNMSDLTVTCCGRRFLVHKAIVCSQSSFFDKACNSGFREGTEDAIDLPEEDPDTVDRFFQFLYSGNYSDGDHFDLLPSAAAMMTPERVSENLQEGVKPDMEESPNVVTSDVPAALSTIHGIEGVNEEDDGDYVPEYCGSDAAADQGQDPLEYDSEASKCTDPDSLHDLDDLDDPDEPREITEYLQHTQPPTSLFISLRVYVMADKYDVPALQLLAKDRFQRTTLSNWPTYDGFPAVVDELFELTAPDDPLRVFICGLLVFQYHIDPGLRARMKPVMEKHSGIAIGVLDRIVTLTHRYVVEGLEFDVDPLQN